jgi:pyruvyl transferase EpsO
MSPSSANKNAAVIARLQEELLSVVGATCARADDYALLDFPNHANVGDSAIYLGEIILLNKLYGRGPAFVTEMDVGDLDFLEKNVPTGPIFIHGGGNFGDLWPRHQLFREAVLDRFPQRQVIQLPQSIHFSDPAALAASAAKINAHKNFILLVRDRKSFQIAKGAFSCEVRLAPDSAFMLGAVTPPVDPTFDIYCLLRTDKEAVGTLGAPVASDAITTDSGDWLNEPSVLTPRQRLQRLAEKAGLMRTRSINSRPDDYLGWARKRVDRGLEQLSRGKVIVTDRLHAHILSILLGKPHVILDNMYGKIGSFAEAWTTGADFTSAEDMPSAIDAAHRGWLAGSKAA